MSNQVPPILYKYRGVNDRTLSMLASNQVYFANPRDFNDPFDCLAQRNMVKHFRSGMEQHFKGISSSQNFTREEIQELHQTIVETDAADS